MKGCSHNEDYIMSLDEDGETNICGVCLIKDVKNETLDKAIAEIDKFAKNIVPEICNYELAVTIQEIKNLKSALIAMKTKETKKE